MPFSHDVWGGTSGSLRAAPGWWGAATLHLHKDIHFVAAVAGLAAASRSCRGHSQVHNSTLNCRNAVGIFVTGRESLAAVLRGFYGTAR